MLLLAGTDRLDKELMIGQMQGKSIPCTMPRASTRLERALNFRAGFNFTAGKYQLQVFPEAGHFIHEDQAEKTAMVLADFYRRNDRSALVLPPKVGAMVPKKM